MAKTLYIVTQAISIHWATQGVTAFQGADYTAVSGTLTFNPGEKSQTITVSINSDALNEQSETFLVNLDGPHNACGWSVKSLLMQGAMHCVVFAPLQLRVNEPVKVAQSIKRGSTNKNFDP